MSKFYPFIIIISVFFLGYFSFRKIRFLLVFLLCPLILTGCYTLYVFDSEFFGTSGDDKLIGSAGNDLLEGGAGDDTLEGGAGDDWLDGGAGGDRLNGGAGNDSAIYRKSSAAVTVNLATGVVSGGHAKGDVLTEIENLSGSRHADTLTGDENANQINGGAGDDWLYGGAGDDTLNGGAGDDSVSYHSSPNGVTVNLLTGKGSGGDAQGDQLTNIEGLVGSAYDDTLIGDDSRNFFRGGAGNDILTGGNGRDAFVFVAGDGHDIITDAEAGEKLIFSGTTNVRVSVNVVSYGNGNTATAEGANLSTKIDTSRDFNGDGIKDSVITVIR